jgi:hypothetical protein
VRVAVIEEPSDESKSNIPLLIPEKKDLEIPSISESLYEVN